MINFQKRIVPDDFMLACSGGVDSLACVAFLKNGRKNFQIFHFNHKLRPQNDKMQITVENFGRHLDIPVIVKTADEFPIDDGNLESCARAARLRAIATLPKSHVVFCHHLDDSIESYLMKCFCGTLNDNFLPAFTSLNNGKFIIRPFLLTPKQEFHNYLLRKGLYDFIVEDETNLDTTIRRNFIRHEVIPCISKQYLGLKKVVSKKLKKQYIKIWDESNV